MFGRVKGLGFANGIGVIAARLAAALGRAGGIGIFPHLPNAVGRRFICAGKIETEHET